MLRMNAHAIRDLPLAPNQGPTWVLGQRWAWPTAPEESQLDTGSTSKTPPTRHPHQEPLDFSAFRFRREAAGMFPWQRPQA